jgi:hypothetical protein
LQESRLEAWDDARPSREDYILACTLSVVQVKL